MKKIWLDKICAANIAPVKVLLEDDTNKFLALSENLLT